MSGFTTNGGRTDFGRPLWEQYTEASTRIDAVIAWRLVRGYEVFCRGGNLLDERYDDDAGYPAPVRSFAVGT